MNARFTQHAAGRRIVAFVLAMALLLITAMTPTLVEQRSADANHITDLPLMVEGTQGSTGGGG